MHGTNVKINSKALMMVLKILHHSNEERGYLVPIDVTVRNQCSSWSLQQQTFLPCRCSTKGQNIRKTLGSMICDSTSPRG